MAEDSPNRLRFSIEESVWLNKGQEVDEIISMSLEPDISIVENKHYVSVRGSLKLAGEYRPLPSNGEERDEPSIEGEDPLPNQSLRPIDELRESDDGTIEIEHRFPVDITIPLSRIERLEDIYVMVDAFDYTLPDNDCLRLEADISISGMTDEQADYSGVNHEREENEEEVETVGTASQIRGEEWEDSSDDSDDEWNEPFHYEAVRKAPEEGFMENTFESSEDRSEGPLVEMKPRGSGQIDTIQYFDNDQKRVQEGWFNEGSETGYEDKDEAESEEDFEGIEETEEEPEYSRKEENALYLTKMLTKEEEDFSRLKMCIIQRGESLDTIAERYELPLTQLIRVNRLESEEVQEGQILYIPISS
ncbi:MAG TPA: stage VI sporulation protein D [Bacillales bacterium]|nr:stage VI sporulation protein D [Bacillales bacterium]